ncbi:MAG: tRNA (adenosine(37)-N6)-dimethylallyltransferase MiaA, partial [Thermomicrobiales bacterium]
MSRDSLVLSPLIVIAGPTAVGKTSLALDLAQQVIAELINADSRSFYRGMDIGTAKPTAADRAIVQHHLIDILEPADEMSLSRFQKLAFDAIDHVAASGRLPFLVGGTAQYLNAVVENWIIPQVAPDTAFREAMEQRLLNDGVNVLLDDLRQIDPDSAQRSGPNPRRIIRALEIHRATGKPMSELQGK